MTRDDARAALETFIAEHVEARMPGRTDVETKRRDFVKASKLHAIDHGLQCYIEGRRNGRTDARTRSAALRLEKAAGSYFDALKSADFFWRYAQFHAPELPEHSEAVASATFVGRAARATADALQRSKRVPDVFREALASALAVVFAQLTGKKPTFSSEATFAAPVGDFGRFVSLVLSASSEVELEQLKGRAFARFIEDAAKPRHPAAIELLELSVAQRLVTN